MTDLATHLRTSTTIPAATMTAADSISPSQLPPGLPVYMGYGNGRWPDYQAIVAAHPGATVIDFTVYLANLGNAADVEPGDMTPDQAPTYVKWRLAAGVWRPIVYSSISEMPQVLAALHTAGLNQGQHFRVLTAHYGRGEHICAPGACPEATANGVTADGTQWASYPGYDLSLLQGDFLGPVVTPAAGTLTECVGIAPTPTAKGYWLAEAGGSVLGRGDAPSFTMQATLAQPVVGIAAHPGGGYYLAAADGGVFNEAGAPFFGSVAGTKLAQPVKGIAAGTDGKGYWLAAADGGVFSLGEAYEGGMAGTKLAQPVIGIAGTPTAKGYWLAAGDGGVFREGDAVFHGSLGGIKLAAGIVGIAARPQGDGYWLAGSDGGVFCFGAAGYHGSTGGLRLAAPVSGIAAAADGNGYWLVAEDGGVFAFGSAPFIGAA